MLQTSSEMWRRISWTDQLMACNSMKLHRAKSAVKGKCLQLYVSVYSYSRRSKVRDGYVEGMLHF
jgi:hypothetical protein